MGGERGSCLAKNVRVSRPNYAMGKARKRSEEVAQLRHCVSVDCRSSSLKVQEQSFLPSLRLLIPSGGGGGDHYCRVNWLVWGTPLPQSYPKQAEGEALGGPREIAPFGGHFGRSPWWGWPIFPSVPMIRAAPWEHFSPAAGDDNGGHQVRVHQSPSGLTWGMMDATFDPR